MDNNISEKLAARQDYISRIYHAARVKKLCTSQKDFARLVKVSPATLSQAMNGNPVYLTENLEIKVKYFANENNLEDKAVYPAPQTPQSKGVFIPEETRAMFDNMAETIRIQAQLLAQFKGTSIMTGAIMQAPKNFRTDGK